MLSLNKLAMSAGTKLLFADVNLHLNQKCRYGIVGANGAGKTTLLNLIMGERTSIAGTVEMPKKATLGWLNQDQYLYEDVSLLNVVMMGKKELWKTMERKEHLLAQEDWTEDDAHRLADLEERIGLLGGYEAESLAHKLLTGLGIPEERHEDPLKSLSGGYKLRILLARALFDNPDILLLDEPTNYLDIISIAWLERYLQNDYEGLLLLVSHDHDFLSSVCTHILDIDYGEIRQYTGSYDTFVKTKEARVTQKAQQKETIEKQAAKMRRFIERFGAKATKARQAQSREKQLAKLEMPDIESSIRRAPNFQFRFHKEGGKLALTVKGLSKAFGEKLLFLDVNFQLERGEKVVILGANGVGKSTFIKLLLDYLSPDEGEVKWQPSAQIAYFSQNLREQLDADATMLGWLESHHHGVTQEKIRSCLGAMLFVQDDAFKKIGSLSGGEMTRLMFASIMLSQANILILDEPTNHLDLEAREALAQALKEFKGTVLLVSHDRHFSANLATRYLVFKDHEVKTYDAHHKFSEFFNV